MSGARVFINGISGGIGNAFGQFANLAGAEVSGTCAKHAFSKLKAVGLDGLIDYENQDIEEIIRHHSVDVFIDTVGNIQYSQAKPYLAQGGIYGSSELGKRGHNVFAALIPGTPAIFPIPSHYEECREKTLIHLSNGEFKPVIDQTFCFDEIIDAYRYVKMGHKTGNVLIKFD